MRTLLACLLTLASTACTELDRAVPASPVDEIPASSSPPVADFVSVLDARGPAWAWRQDPSLRVVLSADPSAPGLRVEHGARSLSVATDLGQGVVDLPVLLVFARSDGTEPLAADPSPGLHLLLAGSAEHGCPADDLELDLVPRVDGEGLVLDVHISGVPYLALPPQGTLWVAGADGVQEVDGPSHAREHGDFQAAGFRWLQVEGGDFDALHLASAEPMPWFQLQGHGDMIEVDFDHSCEAAIPVYRAELDLRVRL